MRKSLVVMCVFVAFGACSFAFGATATPLASASLATSAQDNGQQIEVPSRGRRRRVRGERRGHHGIGRAYSRAGRSAARGAVGLARHTAHGRPVRGGVAFGRGMGGFGKHTGLGTARVGKRIGKSVKRALTP